MNALFSRATLVTALFLIAVADSMAAGWYISPNCQVPVRRGQGTDYKIVAMARTGTGVALLEEGDGWARIQLENGKEGWILKRYLTNEQPLQDQVAQLQQENDSLREQFAQTDTRLSELTRLHGETEQELTACLAQRDTVSADYQRLQQDTADVVQTKERLQQAEAELKELTARNSDLQMENTALKKNSALIWFLAGSGVLLLGWLIGLITGKRTKKHRSSLL